MLALPEAKRTSSAVPAVMEKKKDFLLSCRNMEVGGGNLMEYVWTWGGKFFGYISNGYLFTQNGKCVGILQGTNIYDKHGKYIGELMNDNRLITCTSKKLVWSRGS